MTRPPSSTLYETPRDFFARLDAEFQFDLDAFASRENAKCRLWIDVERDALLTPWTWESVDPTTLGDPSTAPIEQPRVFANPPHDRQMGECVRRMAGQSLQNRQLVVGLVRPSVGSQWWYDWVRPYAHEVRLIKGRLAYEYQGEPIDNDRLDSCVLIFRPGVRGPQFTTMEARI